jgi:hypothetical protein
VLIQLVKIVVSSSLHIYKSLNIYDIIHIVWDGLYPIRYHPFTQYMQCIANRDCSNMLPICEILFCLLISIYKLLYCISVLICNIFCRMYIYIYIYISICTTGWKSQCAWVQITIKVHGQIVVSSTNRPEIQRKKLR